MTSVSPPITPMCRPWWPTSTTSTGCARRSTAATRSCTSPPRPTSTRCWPTRWRPSAATPAARCTCSRPRGGPASAGVVYAPPIWPSSDTPADCHDESLPLHPPAHLYTATKLAGELYCHAYGELYGLEHTVLRFGIPYGPRARPAAVIPAFPARALAGEPLTIAGDGSQSRRFVYVEDLAEGVVRALAPAAANRTYNLVGSEDTSVREIALAVREAVG